MAITTINGGYSDYTFTRQFIMALLGVEQCSTGGVCWNYAKKEQMLFDNGDD